MDKICRVEFIKYKAAWVAFSILACYTFSENEKRRIYVAHAHKTRFCGMTVLIGARIFGMFGSVCSERSVAGKPDLGNFFV